MKQNHGPLRNIKGGQSKQDLNFDDEQFNVEESHPKDHDEKLDTQVQSPPPGDHDGGRGVPVSEENGIEKVGVDAEMPKADNQAVSKLRSSDHSPAVEKKEHGDDIPAGAHHTPTKPRKDAAANPPARGRMEEEEHQKHDAVRRGTSEEGLPPDGGNDWPGHAEHNRDDELGRIDRLPDNEGKEKVVVMKKKKDPNGAAPVEINSKSQNKMDKKLKPEVEENARASDAISEPSLPPGVVAIPKKKEVNTQSNDGGQGGVKAVPKVKGAVNGEGERGVEVQMSAVEMAKAIESGEMVRELVGHEGMSIPGFLFHELLCMTFDPMWRKTLVLSIICMQTACQNLACLCGGQRSYSMRRDWDQEGRVEREGGGEREGR